MVERSVGSSRRAPYRLGCAALIAAASTFALCGSTPLLADDLVHSTYLLGIHQGSGLSDAAEALGDGGYELSDGTWVSFKKWYDGGWKDLFVDLLTQLGDDYGVLWGVSTGERGEKYTIDPSLKLGIIVQAHPKPNSTLSLTVTSTLGGSLTELPCQADYGDIGGIQTVNCRLAASPLPPEDTLKYLVKADPNRLSVRVTYSASF